MDISSPTPSDQQYALKWNDFQSSILSSFRHLRDEEDFVDVTLACDQRSFTAHKVVLSACSPYFRKLLKANPCEHPIVILRDIRSEDVENLLRFMYNGEVHIGQEQLSDFLKTAHLLQIRGLAEVTNNHHSLHKSNLSHNASLNPASILPALTASLSKEMRNSPQNQSSTSIPWDMITDDSSQPTPPPQKRIKSVELYKKQHGLTDEQLMVRDHLQSRVQQHALHRERDKSKDRADRDRSLEMKDSLLSQALEGGPTLTIPPQHPDLQSLQAQSTGEDSNSSDTVASDAGDMHDGLNGSLDHSRTPTFANSFLGLPGLLPGPSGMSDNFEMRVRATDPRPCPKCGKIYRSAHTLRTHLEDKHTICPGYRCVLCGTVAKSRNSLHSHMSRQHRGISTKDLPVLPMPSPFDPDLASKLLAKAGVNISAAELRARASPTGTRRADMKLELRSNDDSDLDDPEDLTMQQGGNKFNAGFSPNPFSHPSTTITRVRQDAQKMMEAHKEAANPLQHGSGSALLDTYLQFITENSFGSMGMSQEQAAAAAIQAAKFAQKMALERNLDKLPPNFFPPQLDISKIAGLSAAANDATKNLNLPNVTIEPANHSNSGGSKMHGNSMSGGSGIGGLDIRRRESNDRNDRHSPENSMMNMNNNNSSNTNNNNLNNFNKEESSADERNMSDDDNSIAVN